MIGARVSFELLLAEVLSVLGCSRNTSPICRLQTHVHTNSLPVTLSLSDGDFAKLVAGTEQAQRLFMAGKLKIKGNMMKATKLEGVLGAARPKAKL